ncbi:MAG: polyphosphate kinase 2 family protein [Pyrinomonadaceae bacterium]|nr:polyphosphate kinase 2 family protein [Pyrinomonadaceae bacterium]
MKIEKFKVSESSKFKLKDHETDFTGDFKNKEEAEAVLRENIEKLSRLQDALYAENKQSLLVIFQAMDAAGKDGAIKHVFSGVNPQGVNVVSFKQPSTEELDHDFLWRCAKNLPQRGHIGVFNRSYYEEVLIVRVHQNILENQPLPDEIKADKNIWKKRFEAIRNFENYLHDNGTKVIKFFLNVSKNEQKKRFLARIEEPDKNWKFSAQDAKERTFWDDYMKAYEDALRETSTKNSPWFVISGDKKWFARTAISEIIVKTLEEMNPQYPQVSEEHRQSLLEAKKILENEK